MKRTLQDIINYLDLSDNDIKEINLTSQNINHSKDYSSLMIHGVSTDTRTIKEMDLFVPLIGDIFDGHDYRIVAHQKRSIVSLWDRNRPVPDIPGIYLLVEDTLTALQAIAHEYRQSLSIKVVAITGSNGKTTTKDLIASVLKQQYNVYETQGNLNNHIGVPLTLLSLEDYHDYAVIELGMNHFGEIETLTKIANPDYGVITNIGESHIENLGSRDNIGLAKFELFHTMPSGTAILNYDDPIITRLAKNLKGHLSIIRYGITNEDLDISAEVLSLENRILTKSEFRVRYKNHWLDSVFIIKYPGVHNIYNALTAITIGTLSGIPTDKIQKGLSESTITPMRMQIIPWENSIIINDAYNASPTSTTSAISFLSDSQEPLKKVIVVADMMELGDYAPYYHNQIGDRLLESNIDLIIAYGSLAQGYIQPFIEAKRENQTLYFQYGEEAELQKVITKELQQGCLLLLKGSRKNKLERFISGFNNQKDQEKED